MTPQFRYLFLVGCSSGQYWCSLLQSKDWLIKK